MGDCEETELIRDSVVFVHLISAMVLFGLPLAFGRFLGVTMRLGDRDAAATAGTLRILTHRYLYLSWAANLLTGLYLLSLVASSYGAMWRHGIVTASFLVGINIYFGLERGLSKTGPVHSFESLRKRIVVFSIIHHSLITALTAVMVFRNWLR